MRNATIATVVIAMTALAAHADVITFFTPVDGGYLSYNKIWSEGFDDQTGTTLDTTDTTWIYTYSGIGTYTDRIAWLDFGADWQNVDIAAIWTGYTRSSGSRLVEDWLQDLWWDDDNDDTNDGTTDTALMAGLNAIVGPTDGNAVWIEQANTAFAPQARYLMLHTTSTSVDPWSQRVSEFVFEVVPEPATISLVGLGGLALLRRRRR